MCSPLGCSYSSFGHRVVSCALATARRERRKEARELVAVYHEVLEAYGSRRYRAWNSELEPMHVPIWLTDVGPRLPAAAYCLHVPGMAAQREESWPLLERCLKIAARLDGWAEDDLLSVLQGQMEETTEKFNPRFHRAMRTLQHTCCLVANLCDYTSDRCVDAEEQPDDERFINVITSGAGAPQSLGI